MRILGVDPGLINTGYGIVDTGGSKPRAVEGGVVRTISKTPLAERLSIIFQDMQDVISEHHPEVMAIEDLHSHPKFTKTAIMMGHARGVVVLAAGVAGIPVFDYQPNRAKSVVTGAGHAPKDQVMRAVALHLGDDQAAANEHVADAFAIALCHAIVSSSPAVAAIAAANGTGSRH
jgi:crossover junction endodeoxyribonuclease RuvC